MNTTTSHGSTRILDIEDSFGAFAGDFDLDAIAVDYHEAINALLPDGYYLSRTGEVFRDIAVEGVEIDWSAIEEAADLFAIADKHLL